MNDTAFDVRLAEEVSLAKTFTIRNKFSEKGLRVRRSSKSRLTAVVGQKREYMLDQVIGGSRSRTAIPSPRLRGSKNRVIRRRRWPQALRDNERVFVRRRGNVRHVMRRMGRGGKRLRRLWTMPDSSQPVKKRWRYKEIAETTVRNRFGGHFEKRLKEAIKTAR